MSPPRETILDTGPGSAILTNFGVWSPCGDWIVFDRRTDRLGDRFDGTTIEAVHTRSGEVRELFRNRGGCAAASFFPDRNRIAFMVGSDDPAPDWTYTPSRRFGVLIDFDQPGVAVPFDARDIVAPYTPGALRGGSHVFAKHPSRPWVSFNYEDHVCESTTTGEANRRTTALGVLARPVVTSRAHIRNRDGAAFCVVTFPTVDPRSAMPGDVVRACEEAWIGHSTALAVQGDTIADDGRIVREAYRLDLPEDPTVAGEHPLEGTSIRYPAPPAGTRATRLTHTEQRRRPGLCSPRHWLRSSADGSLIGCLLKDDRGTAQFHVVPASGGPLRCLTDGSAGIASAFTWHPVRPWVTFIRGGVVTVLDAERGTRRQLTQVGPVGMDPLPLACVFSPSGDRIAFQRRIDGVNRVCIVAST